jgi:hypothetical protein
VTPKRFIVTKGDTGPVALFRLPDEAKPGATVTLQPVGKPRQSRTESADDWITDGAVSPNSDLIGLRAKGALFRYRTADLLSGSWREGSRISLQQLGEPQGEGLAFGDERTIYLAGEGGASPNRAPSSRLHTHLDYNQRRLLRRRAVGVLER